MVKRFTDLGFDVNAQDFTGSIPLHTAAFHGFVDIIGFLASEGSEINIANGEGETPLFRAVVGGELEAVKRLYELGADINAKDNKGTSPLKMARLKDLKEIENFLVKHNAVE